MEESPYGSLTDWVAIKPNAFTNDMPKRKLYFFVAWNSLHDKVAVTCRERHRTVQAENDNSWTGMFSVQDLRTMHQQLCLLHPILQPYLPELPLEYYGLWALFYTTSVPQNFCEQLQLYLEIALEICGERLLIKTLFEEFNMDEYLEDVGELRLKAYQKSVINAEERLKYVIHEKKHLFTSKEWYAREDYAIADLHVALAELYNIQLQPFLDLREVALGKIREAKFILSSGEVGERVKNQYSIVFCEWKEQYTHAYDVITDLYVKYYTRTYDILIDQRDRMITSHVKYSEDSELYDDRLKQIESRVSAEKLHLLNATRKLYEHQRDKMEQELVSLENKDDVVAKVEMMENAIYQQQVKIYDIRLSVIKEHEAGARSELQSLFTLMKVNESVYYDATDDMSMIPPEFTEAEELAAKANPRVQQLKQKLISLYRRKLFIRNKKDELEKGKLSKETQMQAEKDKYSKRCIQKKCHESKEELLKKQQRIQQERRKTIERIQKYKLKYPTPPTITTPVYASICDITEPMPTATAKKTAVKKRRSDDRALQFNTDHFADDSPPSILVISPNTSPSRDLPQVPQTPPNPPAPPVPPPPPPPPPLLPHSNDKPVTVEKEPNTKKARKFDVKEEKTKVCGPHRPELKELQDALKRLKKTEPLKPKEPEPPKGGWDELMFMIKQGKQLRKVSNCARDKQDQNQALSPDAHYQLLKNKLSQIRSVTEELDDRDDAFTSNEFD